MARSAIMPVPDSAASQGHAPDKAATRIARSAWIEAFRRVRSETEARAAHLSAEDQIVQSMADASPTKWHRAHVTWFFGAVSAGAERWRLQDLRRAFSFLFNSYYVAAGPRHARPQRGLITRPERRRRRRLSRPCRCRRREADRQRAGDKATQVFFDFGGSACITSSSIRNC